MEFTAKLQKELQDEINRNITFYKNLKLLDHLSFNTTEEDMANMSLEYAVDKYGKINHEKTLNELKDIKIMFLNSLPSTNDKNIMNNFFRFLCEPIFQNEYPNTYI